MARRFQFNLQALLRYREIMEDEKRRAYLEAKRLIDVEKVRQQDLNRQRDQVQDEILHALEDSVSVQAVMASYATVGKIDAALAESRKRVTALEAEVEKRRLAMIGARQETRMMETLKDRRREEFIQEEDKVEQSLIDELSIQARGRRIREENEAAELAEQEGHRAGFSTDAYSGDAFSDDAYPGDEAGGGGFVEDLEG